MTLQNYHHVSVLFQESVEVLQPKPDSIFVDCTLGGGGHTALILQHLGPSGRVIAFDRDLVAIEHAKRTLAKHIETGQLTLVHAPFGEILKTITSLGLAGKVNGILADIGVSSHHLDDGARGFSFMKDGPLDMRMDQQTGPSASDFLNTASEEELADVIWRLGEEPKSRFIAKLICEVRRKSKIETTKDLADLIAAKVMWKEVSRKHPATRTFQALRIFVNDELGQLGALLADAPKITACGGILAIITFHSLEDRMVKEAMQAWTGKTKRDALPRDLPFTQDEVSALSQGCGHIIKPFPMVPSPSEIQNNPRARSAKLRAICFS